MLDMKLARAKANSAWASGSPPEKVIPTPEF
jgi:hypothetical protein